ncbi:hypothetical protein PAM7066_00924 [Palleronia marisminoris]|uniref:DUF4174 domain-containing protein n=2 Tax=Palleronia marisminoris TaxID=315423 RepID=A0A1Y5RTP0_9RHOB|nr:hypothetical protein PAM7066_00924 [Palleronia marisminoris]
MPAAPYIPVMFRHILLPALLSLLPLMAAPLAAQEADDAVARWREDPTTVFEAAEIDLDDFLWIARPVVVFADAPQMPAFQEQMDLIADRPEELARRDVVVVTDTDPAAMSDIRRNLRPRGFQLTVIGKDGSVALRKPFPWDVREITRSIDKMPMRQREIREGS